MRKKPQKTKERFRRKSDGNATIEFVIWFPFIMLLFLMMVDIGFVFNSRAMATKVVQDANRSFSIGTLATPGATAAFIKQRLATLAPNAVAQTTVDDGVATSSVTVPLSDLDVTGTFSGLGSLAMIIRSQQYVEVTQ